MKIFKKKIDRIKNEFIKFLKEKKLEGNKICGYGENFLHTLINDTPTFLPL